MLAMDVPTIPIHAEGARSATVAWGDLPNSRVPGWAYTDEAVYRKELERFFYRGHWCYVGLECEIPKPGDFKRTQVGERSVIVVRDNAGAVHVVENRCAHRGIAFCRERHGNAKDFVCPYHQWGYRSRVSWPGCRSRRGVRQDGEVHGGMPADFDMAQHGLNKLKVARRGGVVFACFDHDVEPFEDYLGPEVLQYFDRVFGGRELELLGYNRQRIPGNWKLMQENIKDPYHPGLLHTWFVTFGLWRADQRSQMITDAKHRHACMVSSRNDGGTSEVTKGVTSFREKLHAQRPTPARHRARALVERPDGGDDDDLPERDRAAAGQQRVHAPHPASGAGCRSTSSGPTSALPTTRGDDAAPLATGQPVRPGGIRLGRRRRGDRVLAAGL